MKAKYTNKIILCTNTTTQEITMEFFLEEPLFDPCQNEVVSVDTKPISKLIMTKETALAVLRTITDALAGETVE